MENITDVATSLFVIINVTLNVGNCSLLCENETDTMELPTTIDDATYWQRILPKFRQLYVESLYGEYYQLIFYFTCVVCVIGYVTNAINVVVLSLTPMAHSMNIFLLVLSVADIFHITTQFSHIVHYMSGFQLFPGYEWVLFFKWNTYFETMFLYLTNWLAVSIGAWRFIAITWPFNSREWCSKERAKIVIAVIVVLSAVLASPIFALITYRKYTHRSMVLYDKTFSEIANENGGAFLKFYWTLLLAMGFVPSLILAFLTFGLIRNLYIARMKRRAISEASVPLGSHRTTVMLALILFLYILSNFPDGCMYLISLVTNRNEKIQADTRHFTDIIRIFMLSNNSAAFFIYYGLGEGFRAHFHRAFCSCLLSRFTGDREESSKTTTSELHRTSIPDNKTPNPSTVF